MSVFLIFDVLRQSSGGAGGQLGQAGNFRVDQFVAWACTILIPASFGFISVLRGNGFQKPRTRKQSRSARFTLLVTDHLATKILFRVDEASFKENDYAHGPTLGVDPPGHEEVLASTGLPACYSLPAWTRGRTKGMYGYYFPLLNGRGHTKPLFACMHGRGGERQGYV